MSASLGATAGRRDAGAIAALLGGGISLPWAPYADGEVVTEEPLTAAASPLNRRVPLLAGATAHEFNMAWLAADWITAAVAAAGLAQAGVPAAAVSAYLDQAGPLPSRAVGQAVPPSPTTSAGPLRPAPCPAWPSIASTSRSSSTGSPSPA